VQDANNPNVQGNSGSANLYLVDGVDTSDPRVQTWGKALNFDTVAEVQVQTAGHTAEYGRAIGGIMNVVTKSGGNEFHGSFRWVESRSEWAEDRDPGKTGGGRTDESRPIVTIGGPIAKDKLWFYVAYEERDNSRGYDWYATLDDLINDEKSQGRTSYAGHYFNTKLTWQVNESHQLVGFFNEDPIDLSPLNRGWGGDGNNESAEQRQFQGGWDGSLQWTGVFSDAFFMSGKLQIHRQELNVEPDSPLWGTDVPNIDDNWWGYNYGAPADHYQSLRYRDGLLIDGTYFYDSGEHSHQFKGGIEYLDNHPEVGTIANPAGYYEVNNDGSGAPFARTLQIDQAGLLETQQEYWALFFQDEWRINKLTLNLGLRFESDTLNNNLGREVVKFGFGDMIAPRLGFAYDLNGDSINGSIGRFYYQVNNYIADYFNVIDQREQYWEWNATCDPAAMNAWEYPDACWDLIYDDPVGEGFAVLDSDIEATYQDVLTLGYRKRLNDQMAAGVTYVYRTQDDQIDVYALEPWNYRIGNVPKNEMFPGQSVKWSEYQAIMLDFEKRFGQDRISIQANYTYTMDADSWTTAWWRDLNPWQFWHPETFDSRLYGATESPHYFKFFGSYVAPWDMVVGLNFRFRSGNEYSKWTYCNDSGYQGAGDDCSDWRWYTQTAVDGRGSEETRSNIYEADLYLEQPFTIGPVSVAAYINVFNLLDRQGVTGENSNFDSPNFGNATGWQTPRSWQVGVKLEF
jgi:hypothetical protein